MLCAELGVGNGFNNVNGGVEGGLDVVVAMEMA
jgi:hypothetical protein